MILGLPAMENLGGAIKSSRQIQFYSIGRLIMIASLSNWINKISTGWIVINTLMIIMLFTALVPPNQARISLKETGSSFLVSSLFGD